MKHDEFAFINRQLAGMLQSGVPLEGALKQLCQSMRQNLLRQELELLETDLSHGVSLSEALSRRRLPPFYVAMLKVGVKSNQLPKVLIMLADYYQNLNSLWTRLRALMVYPSIVFGAALLLSLLVAVLFGRFAAMMNESFRDFLMPNPKLLPGPFQLALYVWLPAGVIAVAAGLTFLMLAHPGLRRRLRWRLPAFHEAGLAQAASAMAVMLENGSTLPQAVELLRQVEAETPAAKELEQWSIRLAAGHKRFTDVAAGGKAFPPLFVWLVAGSGEDWVGGFRHAAQIYYARAMHRIEIMLYAVLPASVIALGILIVLQILPMTRVFLNLMQMLDYVGE